MTRFCCRRCSLSPSTSEFLLPVATFTNTLATGENLYSRNLEASWALDVHEERVWLRDDLLKLVGSGLDVGGTVEEIDSESLFVSATLLSHSAR